MTHIRNKNVPPIPYFMIFMIRTDIYLYPFYNKPGLVVYNNSSADKPAFMLK